MTANQITINFPAPYEAQKPVIKACLNLETSTIVLNGSRQVGKTFLLSMIAVYWALQNRDQHIMVVSPTDSQVKKIYQQIVQMMEPAKSLIKNSKAQTGDAQVLFTNNSKIIFRSAASENSLRGYSNTHVLLDEAAFIKEDTWNTIIAPTAQHPRARTSLPRCIHLVSQGRKVISLLRLHIIKILMQT